MYLKSTKNKFHMVGDTSSQMQARAPKQSYFSGLTGGPTTHYTTTLWTRLSTDKIQMLWDN